MALPYKIPYSGTRETSSHHHHPLAVVRFFFQALVYVKKRRKSKKKPRKLESLMHDGLHAIGRGRNHPMVSSKVSKR